VNEYPSTRAYFQVCSLLSDESRKCDPNGQQKDELMLLRERA
jgi:hypothetical protein